jgi:hypothetical protein
MHSLIQIHAATHKDAETIGLKLRPQDREEVAAALGIGVQPTVTMMVAIDFAKQRSNAPVMTIRINEEPMAMFGVYPDEKDSTIGNIWMLTTTDFPKFLLDAHRFNRSYIRDQIKFLYEAGGYLSLRATSYGENEMHHKWLRAFGFKHDGYATSAQGLSFLVFVLKGK